MKSALAVAYDPQFGYRFPPTSLRAPRRSWDADGTFELKDLPAGTYTIEAWHEEFGTQAHSVTVTPEATTEVIFTFRAEA